LAGIQTEGKLGNSTEYNDALETLKVSQIVPEQRLIERFFNDVLKEKGFEDRVRLKEAQKVQAQWSENTLFQVMTKNEIRESIGLEPIEEAKPMVSNVAHRFTDVKTLIGCFAARAKKRDEFEIIESRPYEFALNKEIYRNILAIIKENPLMDNESIAKALKRPLKDVQETISYLEKEGYIDSKKITSQGLDGNTGKQSERSISKKADEILKAKPPKFDNYEIMYSYEWRPDVRDRDVTNSRDFCVELLNLDAFYSREDIESISQEVGWDVFRHRGGFWNDDGKIRPYCRHIWVQNVVKKKNG
jgi:Mn-dependent DtxR family transcriptional regulator